MSQTKSVAGKTVRVVLIGGSGYAGFEVIRILLRHPNAQLVGVYGPESELGAMEAFYPLLSKQVPLQQELFSLFEQGKLKPHVMARFPLAAYREALATVRDRKVLGKVVLNIRE